MLLLAFLGYVEDVAEEIDTVVFELEVERFILLCIQISLGGLISTSRIREEKHIVGVLVAVSKWSNRNF